MGPEDGRSIRLTVSEVENTWQEVVAVVVGDFGQTSDLEVEAASLECSDFTVSEFLIESAVSGGENDVHQVLVIGTEWGEGPWGP